MFQPHRYFRNAARLACLLNLGASGLMVLFLQEGLDPTHTVAQRLTAIAAHAWVWRLTWIVWIMAALSLIYFFVRWARLLWEKADEGARGWIIFGALVGCLGMIPDALAETLYIGLLPVVARDFLLGSGTAAAPPGTEWIGGWMQAAQTMTGFLGNGFYCVGGLTLNLVWLRLVPKPIPAVRAGMFIWIVGLGLSAAALTESLMALMILTALTMGSFVLWSAWLGWFWHEGGDV